MEDLVAIAKIVKPRGLRGEVVADILTDVPDRFENLDSAVGVFSDGTRAELKIENFRFQKGRVLLSLAGYDSIEKAEALRDVELCIPESAVAELDEDEYFDWQLEGCDVETIEGEPVGKVREVMRTGGTEILVVDSGTREYLIPFAESICPEVDIAAKKIRIDPPEGLLEF